MAGGAVGMDGSEGSWGGGRVWVWVGILVEMGDLKIPARISHAQVGPQQDFGMVSNHEAAMNIET